MTKPLKIILSIACIPLGYAFLYISWGGIWNFGVLINSIMFCAGPGLIIGGFVYLIVVLAKKEPKSMKYIPAENWNAFRTTYEKEDIWQIHSGDYWLTIFLYKEDQKEPNKHLPKYDEIKKTYLELINKYVNATVKEIHLTFDSKENFEKKFGGSWYDYYH